MTEQNLDWKFVKSLIRRRWKSFAVPLISVLLLSLIIAFVLPPIYRAQTTILIEERQIPESIINSTVTTFAEERLNLIKEQVLSYPRMKEIIEDFDLYRELRMEYGVGEAVKEMLASIYLEPKSASFVNPKTGRSITATIAFVLYYEGREPEKLQKVTNVLGELFIEEDIRIREKATRVTTGFLNNELENLKKQIQEYDQKISDFKQEHWDELPEYSRVNLDSIARLERDLDRVEMEIRNLEERKINLEGQIATVDPLLPIQVDGKNVARNPSEQLKYLRLKLLSLQSVLSEKHPDIKNLKSEIKKLEAQVDVPVDTLETRKRLDSLRVELAALKGQYGTKHPDVVKLEKEIELLEDSIRRAAKSESGKIYEETPDNPTYIHLKTQILSTETSIRNLERDRQAILDELNKYRRKIENAPVIEKKYNELTRDYEITNQRYNDLMNKLITANVSKGIEEGQHGQRFEIKSPAYLPSKPYKPNRIAIVLLGMVLGSGIGAGFASLREYFDTSIKNEKDLSKIVDIPVLTVLSRVETRKEKMVRLMRGLGWVFATFCLLLIGAKMIDAYIMPLDEVWSSILKNAKSM